MARHVKRECRTDPARGCAPAERDLREHVRWGVVILDKPSGPTSRGAAERVRGLVGAEKAGHGGTLDPKVTGVLPVLLENATRVAGVLLGCDKAYEGEMLLHGEVSAEGLEAGMEGFRGRVEQVPPRRSSVKRRPRERTVHAFETTGRWGRRVEFRVRCQGGTYVRKLVHDLGRELGCGAHMTRLRRTQSGPCGLSETATTDDVESAARAAREGDEGPLRRVVRPVEEILGRVLPAIEIDDGAVHAVCGGRPLAVPGICGLDEFAAGQAVAVLSLKGELVGVGEALICSEAILTASRGLAAHVGTVLMGPQTYPRAG